MRFGVQTAVWLQYGRPSDDIRFDVIYVGFDELSDEKEREYFNHIPTSFHLEYEQVDKLRIAARKILGQSKEFERFLRDVGK